MLEGCLASLSVRQRRVRGWRVPPLRGPGHQRPGALRQLRCRSGQAPGVNDLPTFAEIELWVSGLPQTQGNKTGFQNPKTGKIQLVEGRRPAARASFQAWRQAVRTEGQRAQERCGWLCSSDPIILEATFYLQRPVSYPKWRWLPRTRPDLSKLCRAVEDALTGIL